MSDCWYCHWGWTEQVVEIYRKAVGDLDGDWHPLHFGPGHIVWDDENFDRNSVSWCLTKTKREDCEMSDEEWEVAMRSLRELLDLPEEILNCEPKEYDGKNPSAFPPPAHIKMIPKRNLLDGVYA